VLETQRKSANLPDSTIHTLGLHACGPIAGTRFDYAAEAAFQFGENGQSNQQAFSATGELGYSFDHQTKPRLSAAFSYASGNRVNPDYQSERFNPLSGTSTPFSYTNVHTLQNMIAPRVRLEWEPFERGQAHVSYGAFWLASDTDAWGASGRIDPSGGSGDFIGRELDCSLTWRPERRIEISIGYIYFLPGRFVDDTGPSKDTSFLFISTTIRL